MQTFSAVTVSVPVVRSMIEIEVLLGRERDHDLEQEAVELGLGEGIGPLHLERVLGREHEERRIEREALAGDRDLVLLHRLEQR